VSSWLFEDQGLSGVVSVRGRAISLDYPASCDWHREFDMLTPSHRLLLPSQQYGRLGRPTKQDCSVSPTKRLARQSLSSRCAASSPAMTGVRLGALNSYAIMAQMQGHNCQLQTRSKTMMTPGSQWFWVWVEERSVWCSWHDANDVRGPVGPLRVHFEASCSYDQKVPRSPPPPACRTGSRLHRLYSAFFGSPSLSGQIGSE